MTELSWHRRRKTKHSDPSGIPLGVLEVRRVGASGSRRLVWLYYPPQARTITTSVLPTQTTKVTELPCRFLSTKRQRYILIVVGKGDSS